MTHSELVAAIVAGMRCHTSNYPPHGVRYLELGIGRERQTFDAVIGISQDVACVGVDVDDHAGFNSRGRNWETHKADAIEWLGSYDGPPFDVIFIDDRHEAGHLTHELSLALHRLSLGGVVIIHDTWPPGKVYLRPEDCGDVWRVAEWLQGDGGRVLDVESMTLPFLCGLTLVRRRWRPEWME